LINREAAGTSDKLHFGFRFEKPESNWRDAFHAGSCDEGARALATSLGWSEDLDALMAGEPVERAPWIAGP